jgi:ubiquinone/menaquinone biosynthesis C-methylase UbiE
VGFYDDYVLPRLLDLAMRHSEVARYRRRVIPKARGRVLEIGIGSGLNLPFYTAAVDEICGVDPSASLLDIARQRTRSSGFRVQLVRSGAETLALPDRSFDTVVVTFTLCSVADPALALAHARRVLEPAGTLLFAEHGLAPEPSVQRWQRRLNPVWRKVAGGCNLDRDIDELIVRAGFELGEMAQGYAKGPRPMAYVYSGEARPILR